MGRRLVDIGLRVTSLHLGGIVLDRSAPTICSVDIDGMVLSSSPAFSPSSSCSFAWMIDSSLNSFSLTLYFEQMFSNSFCKG